MSGRAKRRYGRWAWRLVVALVLLGAYLFSLGAAYQVGVSQSRAEVERLVGDLARQRQVNQALQERLAVAERDLTRLRELQDEFEASSGNTREPSPEAAALSDLIERKLAEGVAADRLALYLELATREPRCDAGEETKRILLRTQLEQEGTTASFAGGLFSVSGSGESARDSRGRLEAWYDPAQPVEISIRTDSRSEVLNGKLPLDHAVHRGNKQYLFTIRRGGRRGFAEVAMRSCDHP